MDFGLIDSNYVQSMIVIIDARCHCFKRLFVCCTLLKMSYYEHLLKNKAKSQIYLIKLKQNESELVSNRSLCYQVKLIQYFHRKFDSKNINIPIFNEQLSKQKIKLALNMFAPFCFHVYLLLTSVTVFKTENIDIYSVLKSRPTAPRPAKDFSRRTSTCALVNLNG